MIPVILFYIFSKYNSSSVRPELVEGFEHIQDQKL